MTNRWFLLLLAVTMTLAASTFWLISNDEAFAYPRHYRTVDNLVINRWLHTLPHDHITTPVVDEQELNLGIQFLKNRITLDQISHVSAQPLTDQLIIKISRQTWFDRHLNARVTLQYINNQLVIHSASLNAIDMPTLLIDALQKTAYHELETNRRFSFISRLLNDSQHIYLQDGFVAVSYADTTGATHLVSPALSELTRLNSARLQSLPRAQNNSLKIETALPALLVGSKHSPDNRLRLTASLIALARHAADQRMLSFTPWKAVDAPIKLTINNREDLAQHFLTAAMISLYKGAEFADLLSLYKELKDSRKRSGFGIADLAADHAGMQFAALLHSDVSAERAVTLLDGAPQALVPQVEQFEQSVMEDIVLLGRAGLADDTLEQMDTQVRELVTDLPLFQSTNNYRAR